MRHSRISRRQFNLSLAAGAASICAPALGQGSWPSKPVRIVVPYTPGGFTDQMARLVQPGLQARLGQPVVIDNKPGANSLIGVDAVAKSPPDGSTFGVVIAAYAANTTLYPKLPYDPAKDLMGVSLMGVSPLLADDLSGLAPALVVVAGFDPLRDEGIAYAARLQSAGVPVAVRDEPTLPHGFLQLTGVSRAAARATDDIVDELRAAML